MSIQPIYSVASASSATECVCEINNDVASAGSATEKIRGSATEKVADLVTKEVVSVASTSSATETTEEIVK